MQRKKNQENLKYMVLSAVFAAMIFVTTAFVHIPTHQGYIHAGDGIIYLAASLLPTPYAICASAIGAGLSDYMSGYAMWILPTMLIKAMSATVFTSKRQTIIDKRNMFALLPASVICIGGYYAAGAVLAMLSGSPVQAALTAAIADVPSNFIQCVASSALFISLGMALDKSGIKHSINPQIQT